MKSAYKDKLPGGVGDDKTPSDFDPDTLYKGMQHELEHTSDKEMAVEIAIDHLTEDPNYYNKLEKIEPVQVRPEDKRAFIEGDDLEKILSMMTEIGHALYDRGDFELSNEAARFVVSILKGS